MENSNSPAQEPTTRESPSIFAVLRRRAWVIVASALLAGAAATAFALAKGDTYESTAKLLFSQTIGPELNALGLQAATQDADNLGNNNVQVVDSRRVAVVTSQELRAKGVDKSVDDVDDDVTVEGTKDAEVVSVTATDDTAAGAAQLASVYTQTAARLAEADQRAQARRVLGSIDRRLASLSPEQRNGSAGNRLEFYGERLRALVDVGTGSPKIIQPGYVPTKETGNPLQTALLGLVFGLVLGVALALIREQADRRLHRAEDVSGAFDAPVVTTVPRNRALKKHVPFADLPPEVAEAFRMLQVNLRYGRSEPVRTLLVTSSRPKEGKTTVAWNLASAAASSGLSVALVEADMRRPTLSERYGLAPEPGLAEVLHGEIPTTQAMQHVSMIPGDPGNGRSAAGLAVIVAGRLPHDPWALTQSDAMESVLETLKLRYDLVVLDTPPIPHVADAISLLGAVDGVLITALLNNTRGPDAERLRDQLSGLGATVIGIVANGGSAADGYAYVRSSTRDDMDRPPSAGLDLPEFLPRR